MNEVRITGLTMDSRRVKPGDLFIAVPGFTVDGRKYINQAIQRGAVAVLAEHAVDKLYDNQINTQSTVPIIEIENLRNLIGPIASRFFAEPSKEVPIIGITGTNGKTSTAHFIAQILTYCKTPCAIMGTLGFGFLNNLKHSVNPREAHCTTQDAIATQETVTELRKQGAKVVAMEVTSHALTQGRVAGLVFNTTIFTNLTRDHLEYHTTIEQYWEAKKLLFTEYQSKNNIINLDDTYGQKLIKDLLLQQPDRQVIGYTITSGIAGISIPSITTTNLVLSSEGIQADLKTPWGEGKLQSSLLGHFNISNLLAVLAAVCVQGVPFLQALEAITHLQTVPGRMMRLGGGDLPLVVVDYAHTPDALTQVLKALRPHCQGKLWCVFGCGGDRDRGKRPLMTEVVCNLSDEVVITQDNPRTEDPQQIMTDMLQGLKHSKLKSISDIIIEPDRRQAILQTVQAANANDLVVIAGKGHENYQIIGADEIPFSDHAEVLQALERKALCAH
jgi:UDP-N-acetylmuramoyl-L-alanyl-D-glutamate--2,6-diaminopimelate ligase